MKSIRALTRNARVVSPSIFAAGGSGRLDGDAQPDPGIPDHGGAATASDQGAGGERLVRRSQCRFVRLVR
eukprot:520962-Pyramimonas_sp.AAC.2